MTFGNEVSMFFLNLVRGRQWSPAPVLHDLRFIQFLFWRWGVSWISICRGRSPRTPALWWTASLSTVNIKIITLIFSKDKSVLFLLVSWLTILSWKRCYNRSFPCRYPSLPFKVRVRSQNGLHVFMRRDDVKTKMQALPNACLLHNSD